MGRRRTIQHSKQARFWFWTSWVGVAIAMGCLIANIALSEVLPYNTWGLAYGIAALTFLIGVTAWAVRRRTMRFSSKMRLGRSRAWLYFHIYGGLLFLLLVGMHSGFKVPAGTLTLVLWCFCIWTVLSGLAGLALQQWVPRVLASGLSIEVLYERIPELIEDLRTKAESVIQRAEEPIQEFYAKSLSNSFSGPQRRLIYFLDITGGIKARLRRFDYLRGFLTGAGQEKLNELERLYKTKLEIDAHFTLQQPLRWWLYAHVPTSLLLLALVALHLLTVFYY